MGNHGETQNTTQRLNWIELWKIKPNKHHTLGGGGNIDSKIPEAEDFWNWLDPKSSEVKEEEEPKVTS